jgi:hypothetical protein
MSVAVTLSAATSSRRVLVRLAMLSLALVAVGCGDDEPASTPDAGVDAGPADAGMRPDYGIVVDEPVPLSYCPGSPDCLAAGDDVLYAGAAAIDITPDLTDADYQTVDVNGNGAFDASDGDQFMDKNGNGIYEGVWIAGYGSPRGASGVRDPQWARAIALRHNGTTLVLVSIDVVGYFRDDVQRARAYARDMGVDFDHLLVSSTHNHEGRDTIGIWGPAPNATGRSDEYNDRINRAIATAAKQAVDALAPAHIQYAVFRVRDMEGGVNRYVGDGRDPNIIDDDVRLMRFTDATDETRTIATLVNFAAHPEYTGSENQLLSSDFVHWLREGVEDGVTAPTPTETDLPGLGGICVFYQGALGVQIGPGRTSPRDFDGTTALPNRSLRAAEVLGTRLAQQILRAFSASSGVVTDETAALAYRNYVLKLKIENVLYQLGGEFGVFTRELFAYNPNRRASSSNPPWAETEIAVLDIGRARILTAPGELDPMLFVGGKDGSYTPAGVPVVDTTRENPPDLTLAPDDGYLKERAIAARPDAEYVFLFGCAEDFLGYFVPPFDYELGPSPYTSEAPGDHYEETNSIGPEGWPRLESKMRELIEWVPPTP